MSNIDVGRLHSRFRLPHGAAREWMSRIEAIRTNLVDTHLEPALAPFAMTDEVICVRRIALPLRLSGTVTDWHASLQWSALIADALQGILARNTPDELLRFPHELAARQGFLADALLGRDERDWAWRQLSWLAAAEPVSDGERLAAAIATLAGAAEEVVPALRSLAATGLLPALASRLDRVRRDRLLLTALNVIPQAAPALARWVIEGEPELPVLPLRPHAPGSRAIPAGFRAVLQSTADPEERRAWAILAVLSCTPHRLRATPEEATATAAAWLQEAAGPAARAARREQDATGEAARPLADRSNPAGVARRGGPAKTPQALGPDAADRRVADAESSAAADAVPEDGPTPAARGPVEGETAFGGLLFLLPLVAGAGALDALLEAPALADWPLAAVLHRLALALLPPLRPVDPAALAFAGLMPDAVPPDATETGDWRRAPDEAAALALGEAAALIAGELAARLPQWAGPALVQRVAERPAVIAADPGWIEVRLRLAGVSVELRRAALDLDPGFLPWLGIVLRYRYA